MINYPFRKVLFVKLECCGNMAGRYCLFKHQFLTKKRTEGPHGSIRQSC